MVFAESSSLGRPLELIIKDDTANPEVGLQRSQELIKDGVVATIGFCNTGVAMKSLEVFQTAKSPLIVPCATGTPITSKYPAPESYIFRTSARDAIQAPFVVDDIVARGWTRVAIFADTSGYGESGLQDVIKALEVKNLKPVHVARFALGVKDFTAELKAVQAAGVNVIFSYTVGQALGWKVTQEGPWSLSLPFFLDGAREAADGSLMAAAQGSKDDKDPLTSNRLVMGRVKNGAVTFAYPEDRTRNLFVQRKQ